MITGPVWPGMVPVCDHFLSILTSLVSVLGRAPDWTLNQSWFSCSVMSDSCDPMNCSPPGSSVHGISQARILEGVAMSFSRGSSWPRDGTQVSCTAGGFFTMEPLEAQTINYIMTVFTLTTKSRCFFFVELGHPLPHLNSPFLSTALIGYALSCDLQALITNTHKSTALKLSMSLCNLMDKVQIQAFRIFDILALLLHFQPCFQLVPYRTYKSHKWLTQPAPILRTWFCDLFAQLPPAFSCVCA